MNGHSCNESQKGGALADKTCSAKRGALPPAHHVRPPTDHHHPPHTHKPLSAVPDRDGLCDHRPHRRVLVLLGRIPGREDDQQRQVLMYVWCGCCRRSASARVRNLPTNKYEFEKKNVVAKGFTIRGSTTDVPRLRPRSHRGDFFFGWGGAPLLATGLGLAGDL